MMVRVEVKPTLWEWACRRGSLDEQTLLDKFPQLPEWKAGTSQPTLKQLEQFAKTNHIPLGMLFLPEPPTEELPIPDFRTIKNTPLNAPSQNLLETIYICQRRQDWYSQYLKEEGIAKNEFVGCMTKNHNVIEVAQMISDTLDFSLSKRQQFSRWEDTLGFLVEQVHKLNILVMISGIVGNSTNRPLDLDEFRGFVLMDQFCPLIFINGKDTKTAQIFTLAHELAHIWLGSEGISNIEIEDIDNQQDNELWCNQVAAELLVPSEDLQNNFNPHIPFDDELKRLTKYYQVSSFVIIRRLYDLQFFSYSEFRSIYQQQLEKLHNSQSKSKLKGGGDFYRNLKVKVSEPFLQALVSSTLEGKTLFRDAFRLLGINKSQTFFNIANKLQEG